VLLRATGSAPGNPQAVASFLRLASTAQDRSSGRFLPGRSLPTATFSGSIDSGPKCQASSAGFAGFAG
jgi:hypothetical protein